MTTTQRETLRFIYWYRHDHGYPPKHSEMMEAFNLASKYAVVCRLRTLVRNGWLTTKNGEPRTCLVTEAGLQALGMSNDPWPFSNVEAPK